MADSNNKPVPVPFGSSPYRRNSSPGRGSPDRSATNARLASPVVVLSRSPSSTQLLPDLEQVLSEGEGLEGRSDTRSSGPGASAISQALHASLPRGLGRGSHGSEQDPQPGNPSTTLDDRQPLGTYGSFPAQPQSGHQTPRGFEDFEVIKRHLAGPYNGSPPRSEAAVDSSTPQGSKVAIQAPTSQFNDVEPSTTQHADEDDEFNSLKLQGGDITRQIYRRTEAEEGAKRARLQRSRSLIVPRPQPEDERLDIENIRQPGGFRRDHIRRTVPSPRRSQTDSVLVTGHQQTSFLTRNFYEFLSLYGHFAGEDVDDDDDLETDAESQWTADGEAEEHGEHRDHERRPLLKRVPSRRRRKEDSGPKKGAASTVFILLKSFVGTGVLFLPRAFYNGGMVFSLLVLLAVAGLSNYCFVLLTTSRVKLKGSYADMGDMMYGKTLRFLINFSLVISQVGFSSAYIVFTSENLQAFILAVSNCKTYIDIKLMILMQLVIFLPLSLYRNLNNTAIIVYIADVFIVLGLIYLYYYDVATIVENKGVADIIAFNSKTWTLFIGTAIFTFEGIGLLIPIQQGMKRPEQLPSVLGLVMIIISVIFLSVGSLSYAAYGSKTQTVIILNMDQRNKFVNGVQFLYSLAIVLSTPMQIFPAITIMEKGVFTKSGKYSKWIKWRKNVFRFLVVIVVALIAWIGSNDLDKFVSLVGSFACIPLVYLYPSMIHYRGVAETRLAKIGDVLLFILGLFLMTYTSVMNIGSWVRGKPLNAESMAQSACVAR